MLGVISLGVMQLMKNMTKGQKEFEQNAEIRGILNRIETGLQDSRTCDYSLVALKYAADAGLYISGDINAASRDIIGPLVPFITKSGAEYFQGTNDSSPSNPDSFANLELDDDKKVVGMCDELYIPATLDNAGLKAMGCLFGEGKGRIMVNKMWLGAGTGGPGTHSLYIRFFVGGIINNYLKDTAADHVAAYTALIAGTPAQKQQAVKMSGSFGSPFILKEIPIQLSSITTNPQAVSMQNSTNVAGITDPVAGLALNDVTGCYTNLTDTIQAACENFGGTYHLNDGSCRSLRVRSDNLSNTNENGYAGAYLDYTPTSVITDPVIGGGTSTAISTEGHLYVGPMNITPAAKARGSNAWISGVLAVGAPGTLALQTFNLANTNQGDILGQGALRLGTKATASASSAIDDGSIFASSGIQLGAAGTVPAVGSGDIWTSGDYHSPNGIALGTDSALNPSAGDIVSSGGISLGSTSNTNPGNGNLLTSGGISMGSKNGTNPSAGDLISSGGIALNGSSITNPADGSVFGGGSLHLGSHASTAPLLASPSGHIRISGALNVGGNVAQYRNTTSGQAHIQDKAYSYGMSLTEANADALTTVAWVRNRIASTLAPTGSDAANIASDILSTTIKGANSGVIAIQRDTCINTYFKNISGVRVKGVWASNTCRIGGDMQMAKDCSIGYQCPQVYSNTFMYAKTYVRALSYIRSGTYAQIGSSLTAGTSITAGTTITATGRIYSSSYIYAASYMRAARFCIGGTSGTSCITRVRSSACSSTYKVVGWYNGQVKCIPEARFY